jgi:hypothetical protein
MPQIHASWVHGTSVQPERQGYFMNVWRPGFGALFVSHNAPGEGEWFHVALPTPVLIGGVRSHVRKVLLRYASVLGAKITAVHLYDAETKIVGFDNLLLSSPSDALVDWQVQPPHEMKYGLGVSIHVDFGPPTAQGVPGLWFRAAGADFEVP